MTPSSGTEDRHAPSLISDDPRTELTPSWARSNALPVDSPALLETLQWLPERFARYETTRYITLSDADPDWVRTQTTHLERAHQQFLRFCRRLGLQPGPLRHKLVCVIFASRLEYRTFARERDGVADPSIAGYYAPAADRIVFYDPCDSPGAAEAHAALRRLSEQVSLLEESARRCERFGPSDESRRFRNELSERRAQLHEARRQFQHRLDRAAAATVVHEAVHQLAFHTGVQSPYVQYPLWISEGLATAFETESPENAFGPDHEYASRRQGFERTLRAGHVMPVATLATLTMLPGGGPDSSARPTSAPPDEPADDDAVRLLYHQSYALVTWLARYRRTELRRYLDAMLLEPPGRPTRERHLAIFTECFGDPVKLEASWLRYEQERAGMMRADHINPMRDQPDIAAE